MITKQLVEQLDKANIYSPHLPSVAIPHLSKSEVANLQEKIRKY